MLNQIRKLRACHVPRTKLEQLRVAVFKSRLQAIIDSMMAVLRLRNQEQRDALFELVGSTDNEKPHLPWIRKENKGKNDKKVRWVTPVLDVVELFDFVEGGSS